MSEKLTGKIFDIQGFCTQDGPGIRTTVFFKGCPLHCPWCHSPESQKYKPQLCYMSEKCIGTKKCGASCIAACDKTAISYGRESKSLTSSEMLQLITVDRALCDNCGKCTEKCYEGALYICGKDYTVDEIMERVLKDKPFYEASGGGLTISGGECLTQMEFALELLKAAKAEGLNTAVDTTGFIPWEKLEGILPYADLFLYDLKNMDSEIHKTITGVPNELILENAKRLAAAGKKLQIRIPVIPAFNNGRENMTRTAWFCKELGDAVTEVQLLPYHNMGRSKYFMLDDNAQVFEVQPPSDAEMNRHKAIFEQVGIKAVIH